ncbi:hypothetical protein J7I93_09270 [Bacillus sp. ISL-47]|uniref:hypothetical protein n=1 Tax=Bacillus sp. ISL-47 TaxID=2819130 RepID=UPI001BE9AB51|nr:hypothetical protein [Bacillus sp. ISL-47]MBT2688371.1 hypothetical protein [Bacillus sp. ISL-47]MBT2710518.1 hypothetical protein [Pseudomonas sp. ISL-84]
MYQENIFKVKWCPICDQGWVEIVKDSKTGLLYLLCSECENEWEHPKNIAVDTARTEINYENPVASPTVEDVKRIEWDNYIL